MCAQKQMAATISMKKKTDPSKPVSEILVKFLRTKDNGFSISLSISTAGDIACSVWMYVSPPRVNDRSNRYSSVRYFNWRINWRQETHEKFIFIPNQVYF